MKGSSLALVGLVVSLALVAGPASGAPAQTPKRGGTVVVAANSNSEPTCLGWLDVCDPFGRANWRDKVLARPFAAGPRSLRNDLVEGYELTRKPFTVTFRIRPQASWSDGVPVSARDFVFAYDTLLAHGGYPDDDELRTLVKRPLVVDAKTVKFAFLERYGDWRTLLNFPPLPRHALRGADLASTDLWNDGIVDPRTGKQIGSGPFLVGEWERGRQVTLVRNPRYWGPRTAHLDRVVLRFARGDLVQAMRSGEVDVGVTLPASHELQRDSRFRLLATRWAAWEHYEFRVDRGGHPALRNKLVRQALAYAFDRAGIARAVFGASAPPVLDSTMYMPGEQGYEPNWRRYRYRPDEALRLLRQAGCSRGAADGIFSCAGERMRLEFFTTAGSEPRSRNLQVVATQLRRVGIEVVPRYAPNVPLFATALESGEFDVALFQYAESAPEQVGSPFRCGFSYTGYCNRLVNTDSDQLDRIVDPSRRVVVANRIDWRLVADVPTLPLFQTPLVYVVRRGLEGVVPNGFGSLTTSGVLWNAENWWLDD